MGRRPAASIVASPVLIGAVTLLVTLVGVFLAYNANSGLPFVPTYDVNAEIPGGENLVKGNDVRVGGFRVGIVDDIRPRTVEVDGKTKTVAVITMKLDKAVEPLATDTAVYVRPRSALGLKYVELTPGVADENFAAGDTIPLARAREPVEFDDVLETFNEPFRRNSRTALEGYGDALAGRGTYLNGAIQAFVPFVHHLTPVMTNLAAPDTELKRLFGSLNRVAGQVAPIADVQARLFDEMADTFEAISHNPVALQETIERSPPTLDESIASLRVQRPFLGDFAELSRKLRPAVREMPRSLPALNAAFRTGEAVLPRSVALNERTTDVFNTLDDLVQNPNTLLALEDVADLTKVTAPLVSFVAPYQTVCNYSVQWFTSLGGQFGEPVNTATAQLALDAEVTGEQDNSIGDVTNADRPADLPPEYDARNTKDSEGNHYTVLHGQSYGPAIDAQGNADCQLGQFGYPQGPLIPPGGRIGPEPLRPGETLDEWIQRASGGSHVVVQPDAPWLSGPTYVGRRLGIDNLKDVP